MNRWSHRHDDRGAVLPVVVIALTALLALSALAVDVGLLFLERREDQSAVDAGVLAGTIDLSAGIVPATEAAAAIARDNLRSPYSDSEWAAAWGGCDDPGALNFTGTVLGQPTSCISFDGLGTFRMVLPGQEVETAFAGVVGIDAFTTSATAEASLQVDGVGGVLPFAVLGSAASGSELCLRSSSSGTATPPCTGADAGNFGGLEVPQWGNPATGTDALPCNLNKSDQLLVNISVGIDHYIRPWAGTDVVDSCSQPFGPNMLSSFQGISGGLWEGMIAGETVHGTYFPGRLLRGSTSKLDLLKGAAVLPIDNVPLWEYIGYGKSGAVPPDCTRESFDLTVAGGGHAAAEAQMGACLTAYAGGVGYVTLFDLDADGDGVEDIVGSPRFGTVPQFFETSFPSGNSAPLHISGFRGVWLNGLYFGCNGTACDQVVLPGATAGPVTLPNGSTPLDQVTGYLLPPGAVPLELVANGVNGALGPYQVRLSR